MTSIETRNLGSLTVSLRRRANEWVIEIRERGNLLSEEFYSTIAVAREAFRAELA